MKKLISVILSVILAFTVVSCSDNTDDSSVENTQMNTPPTSEEITPESYKTYVVDFNLHNVCAVFQVPEGWSVKKREIKDGEYPQFLTLDESFIDVYDIFDENNNNSGAIGFEQYTEYAGAEDDLMAIYGAVALSNMYNFILDEENYSVVKSSGTGETAITKVYHSPSLVHNNGGLGDAVYGDGILSYNNDCLFFVAAEFKEGLFNEDVLKTMAGRIEIDWITGM